MLKRREGRGGREGRWSSDLNGRDDMDQRANLLVFPFQFMNSALLLAI